MRYNKLGVSGLFVSEICLGAMTFGGGGPHSELLGVVEAADAEAMMARAFEAGVNFVDTADVYSAGDSERVVGRALKNLGVRREEVVIATKVFGESGAGPNGRGSSRGHIRDAVRASLTRLGLDHIDLYQLHGFDPATPVEESLGAMDDLVREGLVRYVGVSNWSAWQVAQGLGVADRRGWDRIASVQAYYSIAGRDVEREVVPMMASLGPGLLAWSPLAGGFLGGKVGRESAPAAGTRRERVPFPPVDEARAYDVIDVLRELAGRKGVTVAQVALAWLLHQPRVSSVIVGAKRIEQLDDNLGAVAVGFDAAELAELDRASRLPAEYPGWMFGLWSQSRVDQLAAARA